MPGVEEFTRAVAKSNASALLIDSENQPKRWVPLDRALASGVAFAVDVKPGLIALDLDTDELVQAGEQAARIAEDSGLCPVWVDSGRNRHLYIYAGSDKNAVESHLREIPGMRPVAFRKTIRPPLSPHRLGLETAILAPGSPTEALRALGPIDRPRALSPAAHELLRHGNEANRSVMALKLASAFKTAGLSFRDYESALLDPRNAGGEKAQELAEQGRDPGFLRRTWDKATPDGLTIAETVEAVERVRQAALATSWAGRTGRTDRKVMLAILDYAGTVPTLAPIPGERKLTELAQLGSRDTTRKALSRLESADWITRESREQGMALIVSLLDQSITAPPVKLWTSYDTSHPVWRDGKGLGTNTGLCWSHLVEAGQSSPASLVSQLGVSRSSVHRALKRLCAFGLAEQTGRGQYRPVMADLDVIAAELGVWDTIERQQRVHDTERLLFEQRWLARAEPTEQELAGLDSGRERREAELLEQLGIPG